MDMSVDVEVGLALPCRPTQSARARVRQALPVARQCPEALSEVGAERREVGRTLPGRRFEDEHAADVHVRGLVGLLELEEGRVQRAHVLGHLTASWVSVLRITRSNRSTYWVRWRTPRNSSRTRCCAAAPSRSRRAGSSTSSRTVAPKATMSVGSTSTPDSPSTIWSWIPPTRLATTGRPFHIASATVSPKPSARLFWTTTDERR